MDAGVVLEMKAGNIQWEHLELHCNKMVNHKVIHIYTQMTDLFLHFFPLIKCIPDYNLHFPNFQRLLTEPQFHCGVDVSYFFSCL